MTTPFSPETSPVGPGKHLLEASAGTGKTHSLIGLISRLIVEEGLRLGDILAVTFTKKAASELAGRLRRQLAESVEKLAGSDDALRLRRARIALAESDNAQIFTIHGYCSRVLREHAFESGLPLELETESADGRFARTAVRNFLLKLYSPRHDTSASDEDKETATFIHETLGVDEPLLLRFATKLSSGAHAGFEPLGHEVKTPALIPAFDDFYARRNGRLAEYSRSDRSLRGMYDALAPLSAEVLKLAQMKGGVGNAGKAAATLADFPLLAFSRDHPERMRALQRDARSITHDELIRETARAVSGHPALAARLRAKHKIALIDEFQDTDAAQTLIFETIFLRDEGRLVYIGDPKQAIYRFRGADLGAYLAAKRGAHEFVLDTNHRSTPGMISAANALFAGDEKLGKRPIFDPGSGVVFSPVKAAKERDPDEMRAPLTLVAWTAGDANDAERAVLRDIVSCIRELLTTTRADGRPFAPSDIAILTPSHDLGEKIQRALRAVRIPSARAGGSVYGDEAALAVRRMMSAALAPHRAPLVRAMLAGPFFGYDAEALRRLARDEGALEYEDLVCALREDAKVWSAHGFAAAAGGLLSRAGSTAKLLPRPGGERILADTRRIIELTDAEERALNLTPSASLRRLEEHMRDAKENRTPSDERRQRLESDRDCVTILTLHSSKGLEFPVVFLPFAWKPTGAKPEFVTGETEIDGRRAIMTGLAKTHPELAASDRTESAAEQARLFYVGVTRAECACVIHAPGIDGGPETPLTTICPRIPNTTPEAAWAAFAAKHEREIVVAKLHIERTPDFISPATPGAITSSRVFRATIDTSRLSTSFSGIAGALGEAESHARRGAEENISSDASASFPAGAHFGDAAHAILRDHHFSQSVSREAVAAALIEAGIDAERWARPLASAVDDWMATPIPTGDGGVFSLRDLAPEDRATEIPFDLPAKFSDTRGLARALSTARSPRAPASLIDALERAPAHPLDGYMTGSIDLVFRLAGRYHALDWKTNRLNDYGPAALAAAMEEHRYHLQHHLYLVALDAHLRATLRDYDPAQHLGGAHYLFVRGLSPARPGAGVFHAKAEPATIAALAEALGISPR